MLGLIANPRPGVPRKGQSNPAGEREQKKRKSRPGNPPGGLEVSLRASPRGGVRSEVINLLEEGDDPAVRNIK